MPTPPDRKPGFAGRPRKKPEFEPLVRAPPPVVLSDDALAQIRVALNPVAREEFTEEEHEVIRNVDAYKRVARRPFPGVCEVLAVIKALGYSRRQPCQDESPPPA